MKKIVLLTYFSLACLMSFGQTICGTNGQLPSSVETIIQANGSPASGSCSYTVRVYFHIVRRSNGTGGQNTSIVNTVFNNLNSAFSSQNISFVNAGYDEINSDTYFNFAVNDDATFNGLTSTNSVSNAINVYLLDDSSLNAGRAIIGGRALAIGGAYSLGGVTQLLVPSLTVSHEMGHCLGLYHTFETSFCNELVNGSNCTVCGDKVCDTPAESPAYAFQENASCAYTTSFQDGNGNTYNPIVGNLMNYVRPSCFQNFTNGQGARMRSTIGMRDEIASAVVITPV